ncbi:MAG: MarR family transcriptional regulator [Actinomycetota bacterium]|nr:MarR family transcriptional regulator [Actinomycetota bacterium]
MARTQAPELSEDQFEAWKAFLRAQAELISTLDRELEAERGLPITFFDVLAQLSNAGGQLRMSELADAVLLSRSGVTRLVDRMERAGLVRREQCETDRRASYATLTPEGKRALNRALPVHLRGIEEHFGRHLSCDEAKTLAAALGRMVSSQDGDAC